LLKTTKQKHKKAIPLSMLQGIIAVKVCY